MARLIIFALALILAGVANVDATWCHQSGYSFTDPKPTCPSLLNTKIALYKACGFTPMKVAGPEEVPAQIMSDKMMYYYQDGCGATGCDYKIMQVVKDQATWKTYDTCEHTQATYNKTFAGKGTDACKSDMTCPAPWCHLSGYSFPAKFSCDQKLATKKVLWANCGLTAVAVNSPSKIPAIVCPTKVYYYQMACNGNCASNSWQIMQVVADQATWSKYDTCEHTQYFYNSTFAAYGSTPCKSDMMCSF